MQTAMFIPEEIKYFMNVWLPHMDHGPPNTCTANKYGKFVPTLETLNLSSGINEHIHPALSGTLSPPQTKSKQAQSTVQLLETIKIL